MRSYYIVLVGVSVLTLAISYCSEEEISQSYNTSSSISSQTSSTSTNLLAGVDSYLCQYQNISITAIAESGFDLVIMEVFKDIESGTTYSLEEISYIKNRGKKVVAYVSLGEASDYIYYWNDNWIDSSGNPTDQAPDWLGHNNPNWPHSYKVRFWYSDWINNYIKPQIQKLFNVGVDGIFLDVIDAYEYWADRNNYQPYGGRETIKTGDPIDDLHLSASLMVQTLVEIANFIDKSQKIVILINAEEIYQFTDLREDFLSTFDAMMAEPIFYEGINPSPSDYISNKLSYLRPLRDLGKVILDLEYVDDKTGYIGENKTRIDDAISKANAEHFILYISDTSYSLSEINPISAMLLTR